MKRQTLRQECLCLISSLFAAGEDVLYPVAPDDNQFMLCGSADGFVLSSKAHGLKTFASAEAVLEALVAVERLSGETDPLGSLYETLRDLS